MQVKDIDKILSHFVINHPNKQQLNCGTTKTLLPVYYEGFKKSFKTVLKTDFPDCYEPNVYRRIEKVIQWRKVLQNLLQEPVIEQKSQQWLDIRKTMITASDFGQALGKGRFGSQLDLIVKKSYENLPKQDFDIPPFVWGQRYEPEAIKIYEHINKTKVHELGLLKNPNYDFFGASPDGITELGVMLEIKCPFMKKPNREYIDIIPEQYYYQIQGQLDTCGLEECDYFECYFWNPTRDNFYDTLQRTLKYKTKRDIHNNKKFFGIMLMKILDKENGETESDYTLNELYPIRSPVHLNYEELQQWEEENIPFEQCRNNPLVNAFDDIDDDEEKEVLRRMAGGNLSTKRQKTVDKPEYDIIYWICEEQILIKTKLEKPFYTRCMDALSQVWNQILHYKNYFISNGTYHEDHIALVEKLFRQYAKQQSIKNKN